jgi:hypothetical protein
MSKWEIARDALLGIGLSILLLSVLGWLSRL